MKLIYKLLSVIVFLVGCFFNIVVLYSNLPEELVSIGVILIVFLVTLYYYEDLNIMYNTQQCEVKNDMD